MSFFWCFVLFACQVSSAMLWSMFPCSPYQKFYHFLFLSIVWLSEGMKGGSHNSSISLMSASYQPSHPSQCSLLDHCNNTNPVLQELLIPRLQHLNHHYVHDAKHGTIMDLVSPWVLGNPCSTKSNTHKMYNWDFENPKWLQYGFKMETRSE